MSARHGDTVTLEQEGEATEEQLLDEAEQTT